MRNHKLLLASVLAAQVSAAHGQEGPPPAPASAAEAPNPPPPAAPIDLPAPAPRGYLQVRASGVFTYQYMLNEDFYLGGAELYLGAEKRFWGIGGQLRLSAGRTRAGLNVFAFTVGPTVEFQLGRWVRAGLGIDLSEIALFRVTQDTSLGVMAIGGHVDLSVDLFHSRGGALFLGGNFSAARVTTNYAPAQLGVSARLGYRFFGPPRGK